MPIKKNSIPERSSRPKSRAEARNTLTEAEAEVIDEEEEGEEVEEEVRRPARRSAPVAKRHETRANKNGHVAWKTQDFWCEGNLGSDPELNVTTSGTPVTSFRIAIYQGGSRDNPKDPIWLTAICWADLAEEVENEYKKGDRVRIYGHLTQRKYKSRGGETHIVDEMVFDYLEYVPPRGNI